MAAIDTNVMLLQILQRMEARDKAAEERIRAAEDQRRADLQAAEERAQKAEEERRADLKAAQERAERSRRDMLRIFLELERSFPETSEAPLEDELRRQYSENSENFPPVSECPSPREERPSPLRDARIDPQQEPVAPAVNEEPLELPKIAHAEPASSAPYPPGPGTSPQGGERFVPPQSPLRMCPEAGQFSLPLSPPGPGTFPPGGERSLSPKSPPGVCPEARQFSLLNASPGLERSPPEGRRFLPRGVSGVLLPPEAEEEDVNQGDIPEQDKLESKEPVGVESDGDRGRAAQKRVPAALRKLHNSFTGSLHPSARNRTRSGGYWGGIRDSRTGANARRNWTRSRPHADEKPENGIRSFGDDEGGDPRGDGQRSGQRRDEVRRKTDNVLLAAAEAL